MGRFTLTHEFNCSVDTFWRVNFDRDMNTALFKDGLGYPEYTIVEQRDTDAEIFRKAVSTPKMEIPAAIQKVLGSGFRFTEETTFNKKTRVATFKGIPSTMADKLKTSGTLRCEAVGANRCRRIIEIDNTANVSFLLNSTLEGFGEKSMRDAYDRGAQFMSKWITDKGLAGT